MQYSHISLTNIRSYTSFAIDLSPKVNLIVGPNGSGKTNLLDALYAVSAGHPFRGKDADMVRHGEDVAHIKTTLVDGGGREVGFELDDAGKLRKQFVINDAKRQRLTFAQRLPVVLFDPEILRMIGGSPSRRRDYIDDLAGRLDPLYATTLNRYARILAQRNELLKQHHSVQGWRDQLFVWDTQLAELAKRLVETRVVVIHKLQSRLRERYAAIAGADHKISIGYVSTLPTARYGEALLTYLQHHIDNDTRRGFTSAGPHRDDIEFLLHGHPAGEIASRGEVRSIMLALKLIEVELVQEVHDHRPLLLLDDVFSELDYRRQELLYAAAGQQQTIITSATPLQSDIVTQTIELPYH